MCDHSDRQTEEYVAQMLLILVQGETENLERARSLRCAPVDNLFPDSTPPT